MINKPYSFRVTSINCQNPFAPLGLVTFIRLLSITEMYTKSSGTPSALKISFINGSQRLERFIIKMVFECQKLLDRKSTRLNSSHVRISYAVFCLKKKK